ncbi:MULTISPECIES: RusA family crossover junction endodeoxyribonuclease [Oligella]|uniref:Uncharacterized protein n=2 Tax=Oligella urethralis TaxID=90245 RepID=A0A095YK22_9BURK|nr:MULTISPECIES: RusA family crossover junction endodeoxyribonuclease [Oligella]KGF22516.1 hypothetical protein HMPREF2130_12060 [Oligella urethralis DNF00040]OFS84497.1 hypothetical protein HMPREF3144_06535 [Oligella sp. HMSC05A10]OFV50055.1 hypothetical protein HMPREF3179_03055 [Oligella sp. HMSC09E12]SPY08159.1 endodeoxyribonuclease RUS [Oligella urethralis]SUA58267.1 endodeoxyribonuclease RUS [Oligella urethralis]
MARIELTLPYPVSANRYWRTAVVNGRVRTYRSKDANDYRHAAQWIAKEKRVKPHDGDYKIILRVHPRLTASKTASKVCVDLDNALKVALDALEGVLYHNDNQVKKLSVSYGQPVIGGALTVIAERLGAE